MKTKEPLKIKFARLLKSWWYRTLLFLRIIPGINNVVPDPAPYKEILDINETNKLIKTLQKRIGKFIVYLPKNVATNKKLSTLEALDKVVHEDFDGLNRDYIEAIKLALAVSLERENNDNNLRLYINTECRRLASYYYKYRRGDKISENRIKILLVFYNLLGSNGALNKADLPFPKINLNINSTLRKIIEEYASELNFELFSGGKGAKADLLKSSILKIITEGKLSNYGLSKEVLSRELTSLSKHGSVGKTFLVIGQGLDEEVKDYIRSEPGFGGSAPYSRNIPYIESQNKFSMFILKSKEGLQSTDDLKNRLIELQGGKPCLLAVYPLDEKESIVQINNPEDNKRLSSSKRILDYIKLGDFDESGFWDVILEHKIPMPELLSLLPLSAFAKNLKDAEITFLDEKTEDLRKEFKIKTVFDWKDIKPIDLANKLLTCRGPKYSNVDKPRDLKERIKTISRNIINSIKEFDKSSH